LSRCVYRSADNRGVAQGPPSLAKKPASEGGAPLSGGGFSYTSVVMRKRMLLEIALLFVTMCCLSAAVAQAPAELPPGSPGLLQPDQLVKALQGTAKPTVLYVGPKFLYAQTHITGAEFVGPAGSAESMENLRKRVAAVKKDAAIVLYCGCCPWDHCPNIRPAFGELKKLGYTNVKALYLPRSFGEDWAAKGYPVDKGQ
jgi:thiosulfate/3-mercaptopyruvate sulfurtransferase